MNVVACIFANLKVACAVSTSFKPGSDVRLSNTLNNPSEWSLKKPACLSTSVL